MPTPRGGGSGKRCATTADTIPPEVRRSSPNGSDSGRAGGDDVRPAARLLTEGAERLRDAEGEAAWPVPFPEADVRAALDRGELFVGEVAGTPVVTFMLLWDDRRIWGAQPPVAGYVHKLAVARSAGRSGVGRRAVRWAAQRIVDAHRPLVRLDTLAANAPLVRLYRQYGFHEVRLVVTGPPKRRREYQLLEASATALAADAPPSSG